MRSTGGAVRRDSTDDQRLLEQRTVRRGLHLPPRRLFDDVFHSRRITQLEVLSSATTDAPANSLDLPLRRSFTTTFSSITPLEVKKASSPYSQLPSDQQWWAVKAKSCVKKLEEGQDGVSFSWSPWSITGKDGGTYPASDSTWSDFPAPSTPSVETARTSWVSACRAGSCSPSTPAPSPPPSTTATLPARWRPGAWADPPAPCRLFTPKAARVSDRCGPSPEARARTWMSVRPRA